MKSKQDCFTESWFKATILQLQMFAMKFLLQREKMSGSLFNICSSSNQAVNVFPKKNNIRAEYEQVAPDEHIRHTVRIERYRLVGAVPQPLGDCGDEAYVVHVDPSLQD